MNTFFETKSTAARYLRKGDVVINPHTDEQVAILAVKAYRRNRFDTWVEATFTGGHIVDFHEGDFVDVVVG